MPNTELRPPRARRDGCLRPGRSQVKDRSPGDPAHGVDADGASDQVRPNLGEKENPNSSTPRGAENPSCGRVPGASSFAMARVGDSEMKSGPIDARKAGHQEEAMSTFLHPAVLDAVDWRESETLAGGLAARDATSRQMERRDTPSADIVRAYLKEIGGRSVLTREAERSLAIAIARARRRLRLALLRDPDVVGEIVRLAGQASKGLVDIGEILDSVKDESPSAREMLSGALRHLDGLRARATGWRQRAMAMSSRTARGRKHIAAAARARVRLGQFARTLPFRDDFIFALVDLVESETICSASTREQIVAAAAAERELRQSFVEASLGLVVSVAKPFARGSFHLLDLVQEGNIGLLRAVDHFDASRGLRFSTYATWWIRQSILGARSNQARVIRLPSHITELLGAVARTRRELAQKLGREPEAEAIAEACGVDLERVLDAMSAGRDVLSLDAPTGEFEGLTLADFVEDPVASHFCDAHRRAEIESKVSEMLRTLAPGQEHILRARFGLDGSGEARSLERVAIRTGVSRERVRQIELGAFAKLRSSAHAFELEHLVRRRRDRGSGMRTVARSAI